MSTLRSPWLKRAAAQLPVLSLLMPVAYAGPRVAPSVGDVREEINKTVTLAPGSQVTIRGINGGVTIETGNGNQAEIHIQITASDREALERRPLLVEDTPNSLTIRTENRDDHDDYHHGHVRHQVRLRVPNSIHLKVSSVNGGVEVGEITGSLAVSSVNGGVRVAQAGSASELHSINGRVSVSLTSLGDQGLRISSINGGLELRIPATTNAELDVRSVNGGVDSDLPLTVTGTQRRGELRGTIGSGGARIDISSVNGGIHLKRL